MTKIYNTLIVGGGASGLISAIELVSGKNFICSQDVAILEKNDRVGKKLIATGNGQGNLTNNNIAKDNFYGESSFVSSFLANLKKIDLQSYLYNLGIPLCADQDGRVFPLSKQASAVLDVFRSYLKEKGVQEITNTKVISITKNGEIYKLKTSNGDFYSKNVILSVGGSAGKQFGTDGSSYNLATDFGHSLSKLYPSLVQIKTELDKIRGLKGLKERAVVTAFNGKKQLKSTAGEVLFTEFGLSGNAIFKISNQFTDNANPIIKIEFLPQLSLEQTEKILSDRLAFNKHINKGDILLGILNKRIGQAVLKDCKDFSAKEIARSLKNFTLKVTGNMGFNYAQVTKGGIKTKDIDETTYQSKLSKGLYIVGEMLDVDGDCGGYNLTFAFTSGIISAKNIKEGKVNV